MQKGADSSRFRVEIAWKTIIKVLLGVLLAYVATRLWPLIELVIVSILLSVPLYRLVLWVCGKGWPRWSGLLLASLSLVLLILGLAALLGPLAFSQASSLGKEIPKLKDELLAHVPAGSVRNALTQAANSGMSAALQQGSHKVVMAVTATLGGLLDVVLVIALTIYFMADGPRALEWLITFFPRRQRPRVSKGLEKIGDRVVAYIIGQSLVSGLFAGYALLVLSLLHVPMAVLVAILAGFLDVVPVLGISITLLLTAALGLTVSPTTSLIAIACFGAYHVAENYFILPKVYGEKLRLPGLAVLLSMMAGGLVAGVVGAIAILPLVAAYPALEGLWLQRQLEPEVVEDHKEQLKAA